MLKQRRSEGDELVDIVAEEEPEETDGLVSEGSRTGVKIDSSFWSYFCLGMIGFVFGCWVLYGLFASVKDDGGVSVAREKDNVSTSPIVITEIPTAAPTELNIGTDDTVRVLKVAPIPNPVVGENLMYYGPFTFNENVLIDEFLPVADTRFVHHLIVFKWDKTRSSEGYLRAREVPRLNDGSIIYAWARTGQKTARAFSTGDRKGIWVGPDTDAHSLILNIHFEVPKDLLQEGKTPFDMSLQVTTRKLPPPEFNAWVAKPEDAKYKGLAVQILEEHRFTLPPGLEDIDIVHTCKLSRDVTIFAYRNHAHLAGSIFSTNLFRDGINTGEVIHRNVQDPQIFYIVDDAGLNLKKDDILQVHCHYNTKNRNYITHVGADLSKGEEMCNQYLMYYPHILNAPKRVCEPLLKKPVIKAYSTSQTFKTDNIGQVAGTAVSYDGSKVYVLARKGNDFFKKEMITTDTVYVLDGNTNEIIKTFGANLLTTPHGLYCDANGFLWITDTSLHQVFKLHGETGQVMLTLGEKGKPGWDGTHFHSPTDVAVDEIENKLYVSDGYGNSRVAVFDSDTGKFLHEWGKGRGHAQNQFNIVHNIAIDIKKRRRVYVADRQNGRVMVFSPNGDFLQEWKSPFTKQPPSREQPWTSHLSSIVYSQHLDLLFSIEGTTIVSRRPEDGTIVSSWENDELVNRWPHDIDIAVLGKMPKLYVAQINSHEMQIYDIL